MSATTLHRDVLEGLDGALSLSAGLRRVHDEVRRRFPFVSRLCAASYDPADGSVRTLAESGDADGLMAGYAAPLAATTSLRRLLASGRPRVVNDLTLGDGDPSEHTARLLAGGYRASYTLPMRLRGALCGFLFFDARQAGVFSPTVLADLDVFGHLASGLVTAAFAERQTLLAALSMVGRRQPRRDPGAVQRTQRVARFARLMGGALREAGVAGVDDEFVEKLFVVAARRVVAGAAGGSGLGVPLAARIVSVAETFDAMTSRRPDRRARSNARALKALHLLAGRTLDPACVRALAARAGELAPIQARFPDPPAPARKSRRRA